MTFFKLDISVVSDICPESLIGKLFTMNVTLFFVDPESDCGLHTHSCGDGQCISIGLVCNNMYDCKDRSDEILCGKYSSIITDTYQNLSYSLKKKQYTIWWTCLVHCMCMVIL